MAYHPGWTHKVVFRVGRAEPEPLRGLFCAVPAHRLDRKGTERNGSSAARRLGVLEIEASGRLLEGLDHRQGTAIEIHVTPTKGQDLPTAHAGRQSQEHGHVEHGPLACPRLVVQRLTAR